MNRFIRLSNTIINPKMIISINIEPSLFIIKLAELNLDGFICTINRDFDASGYVFRGSGKLNSKNQTIRVCKKASLGDYEKIKKWLSDNSI